MIVFILCSPRKQSNYLFKSALYKIISLFASSVLHDRVQKTSEESIFKAGFLHSPFFLYMYVYFF